ncbi:MAG TPA: hypothetical protein ENH60_06245 [Pricia sp.]|nr:hypothetical protein [Pricia sp.]
MFTRKTPGGKFNVVNEALTTGNIFYVDSGQTTTGGTGAGYGREPDQPFTTLTAALAQCTASNGDYIFLMPGHSEAPVATITVDVIGVTIVGLGNGTNRPTFTPAHTAAADTFDITVASVTIKNIYIVAGTNSTGDTVQVNIAAAGHDFTMENCTIEMGDKNLECITVAATAHRGTLKNMKIHGTAANPDTIIVWEGGSDDWTIDGLDGLFTGATDIDGPVIYQNAVLMENLLLRNIRVVPIAAAGVMLDFNSASTGIVDNVLGYTLAATIGELVDAGALMFFDTKFGGAAVVGVQYPSTTIVS